MKLLTLTLRYFKGLKDFTLNTRGCNVDIFGDNATGKTTIDDAVNWLFFDKDSQNKKDFQIKTLDKAGNVLHGLEHEVEGAFEIDGKVLALRKVYAEKWTKKRGSAQAEFTGHTTDYFINGVPVKKSEYEARIAEILKEEIFKLLTSPTYFNEQLHWQNRRSLLLEVCGDLTDEEVIASDASLSKLPGILGNYSLEDYRKIIATRRIKINDELKKIPIRIDEVTQGLPDISGTFGNDITKDIASLKEQIRDKEQELAQVKGGGAVTEKQLELRKIEGDLIQLKNQLQGTISEKVDKKRRELSQVKSNIFDLQSAVKGSKRSLEINEQSIKTLETRVSELRDRWYQIDGRQFTFEQSDTCGQSLPQEQLQDAREKALAAFNVQKSNDLEKVTADGKAAGVEIKQIKETNVNIAKAIEETQGKLTEYEQQASGLEVQIEAMLTDANAYKEDPAYTKKLAQKAAAEQAIAELQKSNHDAVAKVQAGIDELDLALRQLEKTLAREEQYKQGQNRIKELEQQERDLAAEYEKLEGELYLTEQFIRTKVNLLEEKINGKFKMARFKLFDQQVNGGLVECCETTYQGVPYSSGLNNGHRNAVGMDIINTLSEYYNFFPPIFVDNAESITVLPEMKAQVIRLVVSEKDKTLRVETEGVQENLFKEAI